MAYTPPVNIPSLGGRNYAGELYGMFSGVGDAFRQNRRDKVGDAQWQSEQDRMNTAQALAQSNADRNYALELQKFEADQAAGLGGDERWFGNLYDVELDGGGYGKAMVSNRGNVRLVDAPGGGQGTPPMSPDAGSSAAYGGGAGGSAPARGKWASPGSTVDGGNAIYIKDKFGNITGTIPKGGTPPPGYVPQMEQDGSVSMVPGQGTPQELERTQQQTKARMVLSSIEQGADVMRKQVDGVRTSATDGSDSVGLGGRFERLLPWETSASALASRLETIKGAISFDKLQQMREMSPTGGALGAVSDFEGRLLAATKGPLDPNNPTTMVETLDTIEAAYDQAVVATRIAYMTDFEGLDRQIADYAIDAIRQGEDPQLVLQSVMQMQGGQ